MRDAVLRAQLVAMKAMAEASLALLEERSGSPLDEPAEACPHCGNADPERIEDTADMAAPGRRTCLVPDCGKSWQPTEDVDA